MLKIDLQKSLNPLEIGSICNGSIKMLFSRFGGSLNPLEIGSICNFDCREYKNDF